MDSSQNYMRFRDSDQVPTQDFQKSIGGRTGGGKIAPLTHDVNLTAKINERQAEAKRGPVLESVVTLREALRRPSTILKPWAKPNGDSKGGAK